MTRRIEWLLLTLLACILLRLIGMAGIPLTDTSEPRYAEIARLMLATNDWITPWFKPGLPFWGKPPLAFWCQALSMKLLGVNEFAVRLPAWLATLGTVLATWRLALALYGERMATLSALVLCTMALIYLAGAAVLTDPFLILGTTLTLAGGMLAGRRDTAHWTVALFAGLAISLLAKGPIGVVFGMGPMIGTAILRRDYRQRLLRLPWLRGLLAVAVVSLPWYVAAEMKTPGFLHYFIVGEHILRFIDHGWKGDLYGTAHDRPKGMIWVYGLQATFPWGVVFLLALARRWKQTAAPVRALWHMSDDMLYLVLWTLVCPVFFTPAGNILWTYWMPSLPALAVIIALLTDDVAAGWKKSFVAIALIVPVLSLSATVAAVTQPEEVKTERDLVHQARALMTPEDRLVYVGERPFSARFYSEDTALEAEPAELPALLSQIPGRALLAVPGERLDELFGKAAEELPVIASNKRYQLVVVAPGSAARQALDEVAVSRQ